MEELEKAIIGAETSDHTPSVLIAEEIRRLRAELGEVEYEYNVLETDLEDGEECVYWDWGTFAESWKKAVDESAEEKRRVDGGNVEYRYEVIKRRKAGKWEKL